jgi:hypothetical protein
MHLFCDGNVDGTRKDSGWRLPRREHDRGVSEGTASEDGHVRGRGVNRNRNRFYRGFCERNTVSGVSYRKEQNREIGKKRMP